MCMELVCVGLCFWRPKYCRYSAIQTWVCSSNIHSVVADWITMATQRDDQTGSVRIKDIPSFRELNEKVQAVVRRSSWWDLYGVDWLHIAVAVVGIPIALLLLKSDQLLRMACGVFLMGCSHGILANKSGHLASHGALARSSTANRFWAVILWEFVGTFSAKVGDEIHVKLHHPHTNIIGLGDSSTWKAPFLTRLPYMFLAPMTLCVLTPYVAVYQLIAQRDVKGLASFLVISTAGVVFMCYLLIAVSGFSAAGAVGCILLYRCVLAIPYIHINIFQHIGLPMYSQKDRPPRTHQMTTGCLNLDRNPFLDFTFGHSLISCHVEHHFFPKLSDNMCLKIKPIVKSFTLEKGLPYNEDSYWNRLGLFLDNYDSLMVDPPAITKFAGIQ